MSITATRTTNYLKVMVPIVLPGSGVRAIDTRFFFFDERDAEECRETFEAATVFAAANNGALSVYKRPPYGGPWDYVKVIGENFSPVHEA